MKKLKSSAFALIACIGALFACEVVARASCGTLPYTFTNNVSIVDAATTNSNNNFLYNCVTTVDNTQIGGAGIFASQIIPTSTAQATFGGTLGYVFNPATTGNVPLTIKNAASPTVDYFDVQTNAGTKLVDVDKNGVLNATVSIASSGAVTAGGGTSTVQIGGGCASTGVMQICNTGNQAQIIPPSATQPVTVVNAADTTINAQFPNSGGIQTITSGTTTLAYVPPVYTASGGSVGSTLHGVLTSFTTTTSGSCASFSNCSLTSSAFPTLSGAAVFASSSTWACTGSGTGNTLVAVQPTSGSAGTVTVVNIAGTSLSGTVTYEFSCFGT